MARRLSLNDLPEEIREEFGKLSDADLERVQDAGIDKSWIMEIIIWTMLIKDYRIALLRALRSADINIFFEGSTARDVAAIVDKVLVSRLGLGSGVLYNNRGFVARNFLQMYRIGHEYGTMSGGLAPARDIGRIVDSTFYWIEKHYGENVRDRLKADIIGELSGINISKSRFGDIINRIESIATKVFNRSIDGIKTNVSFHGNFLRNLSTLRAFKKDGVRYFRWVALPGCCSVCDFLNGKIFSVNDTLDWMEQTLHSSGFPEVVKERMPFVHSVSALSDIPYFPIHPHCRCFPEFL